MAAGRQTVGVLRDVRVLTVHAFTRRAAPAAAGVLVLAWLSAQILIAQAAKAAAHADAVPSELSGAVAAALVAGGTRVQVGPTTLDFWWVKSVRTGGEASAGTGGWAKVAEGTLVGAVRLSAAYPEIRGKQLKPGVYTLRYALQPENGDHLGVSTYREFLLVSPAAVDRDLGPTGHDGTVNLSKQSIGASHPASLSLDPPASAAPPLSVSRTDEGHTAVVVEVPCEGGAPLRFGLIVLGKIEH